MSLIFALAFSHLVRAAELVKTVCRVDGVELVALRAEATLAVNPATLETRLVKTESCALMTNDELAAFEKTPYAKILAESNSGTRQINANEGLKSFDADCAGSASSMALTMDLCPAGEPNEHFPHRPLDTGYFASIEKWAQQNKQTAHVTLFISGLWITRHPNEVARLKKGWPHIALTYGNHSDTHPYSKGLTYAQNFMTQMSRDQFRAEVLATESKMIASGLNPSVFFRFPGLMSNRDELLVLRELGLIPVGTSAWVAVNGGPDKDYAGFDFSADEAPRAGRIILTHANGNEEAGVRGRNGFVTYLASHTPSLIDLKTAALCSK